MMKIKKFLHISIMMAIHKHFDVHRDVKLLNRAINNILMKILKYFPLN